MKGRKRWIIGGVLVLVAVLVAVLILRDSAPPDGNGGNEGNGEPPPRPWVVRYGESRTGLGSWIGIDPQTIGMPIVAMQTAEILFLSDEETREPTPFLATELEYSENGTYVDIFLMDDVRFHNGDLMTAEDVKFSYDRMQNEDLVMGWAPIYQRWIDHVEVINDYQVRIYGTLEAIEEGSPRKDFPLQPAIIPKNYISEVGWEEWAEQPVLTGALKIVDWERDAYVHYEKAFPEEGHWYWGDLPNYDELIIYSVTEPATRLAMLKAGELDVAQVPPANIRDAESDPKLTVHISEWCYSWDIVFYERFDEDSPLYDPNVRRAVSLAIDRAGIAENVLHGLYEPRGSYWAPYSFGYRYREPDPYDPDEARRILAEAGYPDGFDTSFSFPLDQGVVSTAVIASLAQVGIRAESRGYEGVTWGTMLYFNQHVGMGFMWIPGWGGQYYPEDVFGQELHSYAAQVSRYLPEVEEAYDRMVSSDNEEEYMQATWAAEELIYDELGYKIPLWAVHAAFAYGPTIEEWEPWQGTVEQFLVELKYKG